MPGYETDRFVNLSENDKTELTCSICQDIFCSPLVTQCCQQSFCEDCINDWLKTNNTCPYDRKPMTSSALSRPPRVMLNMLGKLKIHCEFKITGCNEVLLLENLSKHKMKCRYNIEKCKKCLCEIQDKSSHDCIKALLELNRKANDKIEESFAQNCLKELSLLKEIRELRAEKENYLKTIHNLSNIPEKKISEQEIFDYARKETWNPELIGTDMDEETKYKVLSIVKEEISKEFICRMEICTDIVKKLETELGQYWNCILSYQRPSNSLTWIDSGYCIKFKFDNLYFKIYRTKNVVSNQVSINTTWQYLSNFLK